MKKVLVSLAVLFSLCVSLKAEDYITCMNREFYIFYNIASSNRIEYYDNISMDSFLKYEDTAEILNKIEKKSKFTIEDIKTVRHKAYDNGKLFTIAAYAAARCKHLEP
jgi:hypothetical protein